MYAREVRGQTLTFFVSGKLWNRSLVMQDRPTGSLWSHILGEAIEGKLKGAQLEAIVGEMTTWRAWRQAHPDTTVLALSRSSRQYDSRFYARRPSAFVFGWLAGGAPYHARLDVLQKKPLIQPTCGRAPLLVVYDAKSTGARLFSRRVDGRVLRFAELKDGRLRDKETGSVWDRVSGEAAEGPLKGQRLTPYVGLMSFAHAWRVFHPRSKEVR